MSQNPPENVVEVASHALFVVGERTGCGAALFYDDDDWICGSITKRGQSLQFCNVCDPQYGIGYVSADEAMGHSSTNAKSAGDPPTKTLTEANQ